MIDVDGVKNAWLTKAERGEIDICCDLITGELKCCDEDEIDSIIELCIDGHSIPILTDCEDITRGICLKLNKLHVCDLNDEDLVKLLSLIHI